VLAKSGGKALLISRYALDCKPYNTSRVSVTWETCSLRSWLNGSFINSAFSSSERSKIRQTYVENEDFPTDFAAPGSGGNDTTDRIYLLSDSELSYYLYTAHVDLDCTPTAYARACGAVQSSGGCDWWLRSPGGMAICAESFENSFATDFGSMGIYVDSAGIAVRPMMWINL
jgi:hypothetical protein